MCATTLGDLNSEAAVALFESMGVPAELVNTAPLDVEACAVDRAGLARTVARIRPIGTTTG